MSDGAWWVAGGLLGLVAEVIAPGVFLLWLGLAAIVAGLITFWLEPRFAWQVTIFAVLAPFFIAIGLRLRHRAPHAHVNTVHSGLVGRAAVVLSQDPIGLRVRLGDSDWSARLPAGETAQLGGFVVVTGVDGTTLLVHAQPDLASARQA